MKKSKFNEAQILFALNQTGPGTTVAEVCRKMRISDATFYNWKKKYGEGVSGFFILSLSNCPTILHFYLLKD